MQEEFFIRLAQDKDAEYICKIELEAAKRFKGLGLIDHLLEQSFCQEKLKELIKQEQVWVVSSQTFPVGFTIMSILGQEAYLEEISVLPQYGGQGLGTKLIDTVCQWSKSKGLNSILLSTFRSVRWNAPFYEKLGFKILCSQEWNHEMHKIRTAEKLHGYPIDERVFMRLNLTKTKLDI